MAGFKRNEELNVQGESSKKLTPGIYKGSIVEISKGEKQIFNSEEKEPTLNITFRDSETKKEHVEQIGYPKETANTSLAEAEQYAYENLLHIANPYLTEEELAAFETAAAKFKSYEQLVDEYIKLLENKTQGVGIELIIEGSVINGKTAISKFPNFNSRGMKIKDDKGEPLLDKNGQPRKAYKPQAYIAKIGSAITLKETKAQLDGKAAYFKALSGASASGGEAPKQTADDLFD